MTTHKDTSKRSFISGEIPTVFSIVCACGKHVRPHEWRDHIGAAVEALSAKRDAEAAVIEAAKAFRDSAHVSSEWYTANDRLEDAVDALRALEGDA
jgi:hypothetical protein